MAFSKTMKSSEGKVAIGIIVDIIIFLMVVIPIIVLDIVGVPYERGFFCDDATIRYPYKYPIIPTLFLVLFFLLVPIIVVALIEFMHVKECYNVLTKKKRFSKWFWSFYRFLRAFLFGFAISLLVVQIFKFTLGALRPHFLDVCNPEVDCNGGNDSYIPGDVCNPESDEDDAFVRDARLSFMSAHASVSAFCMFFLIFYLQYRLLIQRYTLVRPFLQYICLVLTILVSLSRISDHHHHWSDVLAGFLNGLIFAILCAFVLLKLRKKKMVNIRVCNSRKKSCIKDNK
ncbi:UNVERIFIED_CONTAM: hypothetical protein RMT77_000720 [Armadillidium vulgare]